MADSYDLDELTLIRVSDGWTLNIRNALIEDGLTYSAGVDNPPKWTARVHDPEFKVLNTHRFVKRKSGPDYDPFFAVDAKGKPVKIDTKINGRWYRLYSFNLNGSSLELVFEDRTVQRLRNKYGHRVVSRNDSTRAEFAESLVKGLRTEDVKFYSRELHLKQPIAKGHTTDPDKDSKDPGLSDAASKAITIKGQPATKQQLRDIDTAMTVADQDKAPKRAVIAMLTAGIGESAFDRNASDYKTHTHKGIWQSNQIPPDDVAGQAHHFLVGGNSFAAGGAIAASKISVYTIGGIVSHVEGSDQGGSFYDPYVEEAEAIYAAWSGGGLADAGDAASDTYAQPYQFEAKKDEDYWSVLTRLAQEVKWRCFVHKNKDGQTVVYFMDDYQLLRGKPQYTVQPSRQEHTEGPSFSFDNTQNFPQEFSITVLVDRDAIAPGDVVDVVELGVANGRWIVSELSYSYFSPGVELTLVQPVVPKKEPPHEEAQRDAEDEAKAPGDGKTGQWKLGSGANRAGVGLKDPIKSFLSQVAGHTNESIVVTTGTNHNQYTTSGNVSDHWDGNAADIGVPVDSSKGDNIAAAALIVCGIPRSQAEDMARTGQGLDFSRNYEWNGHRVQIGWRTYVGGNHHNHVHIGVK